MAATAKSYNALTFDEFRTVVLKEIDRAMIASGFEGVAQTLPGARWEWTLRIESQRDPGSATVTAQGSQGQIDGKLETQKIEGGSHRFTGDKAKTLKERLGAIPSQVRDDANLPKPEL